VVPLVKSEPKYRNLLAEAFPGYDPSRPQLLFTDDSGTRWKTVACDHYKVTVDDIDDLVRGTIDQFKPRRSWLDASTTL
jgi:hypothetical protein